MTASTTCRVAPAQGTYTVEEQCAFESDVIVGSSWPNRSGEPLPIPVLTLTVNGNRLIEVLAVRGQPCLVIECDRVP